MPSEHLRRALADNLVLSSTDSDRDVRTWEPPTLLADRTITEARALVPALTDQLTPAREGVRLQWLAQLGILVAGVMSSGDAKAKAQAYAPALDYPALCFTTETKIEAARRFKWFPSFAELAEFFDEICKPRREQLQRVRAIGALELAMVAENRKAHEERKRALAEYEADRQRRWDEAAKAREKFTPRRAGSMRPIADVTLQDPDAARRAAERIGVRLPYADDERTAL